MTQEERYMKLIKNYNKKLEANKKKGVGGSSGWTPFTDFEAVKETINEVKKENK